MFSWSRFTAIVYKEFIQMRRDRLTFGMMVGIPIMQLILFGFAINSDPKHLPYRDAVKNMRPAGYAGRLGYASAGALGDFIVANMVAEAASGSKTPKEAAERAQKRAERYYKV